MLSIAPIITELGQRLLVRALGGEQITFTRFEIGNGEETEINFAELTALVNPIMEFGVKNIDKSQKGYARIEGMFDSTYITSDFRWRELGLYCKGEDGVEVLFAYANDGSNAGMLKANATDIVTEHTVAIIVAVGDAKNVTAILSESALYAPKAEFDAHIADKSNPHNVTAEQLGLGSVPNVATNDQTPTYTIPSAASELSSGEKLSVAFGKIARAIKTIISHIADKSNPHGVSLDDVGGAAKEHTHSAADVTSGVLGVQRGGTGVTSLDALANVISSVKVITYTGNNAIDRIISVGFTPKFVIVISDEPSVAFKTAQSGSNKQGDGVDNSSGKCVEGGFIVSINDSPVPSNEHSTNYGGKTYTAICWR